MWNVSALCLKLFTLWKVSAAWDFCLEVATFLGRKKKRIFLLWGTCPFCVNSILHWKLQTCFRLAVLQGIEKSSKKRQRDCSDLSKIHCLRSNSVIKCSMCFIATFIWLLFKPQYVGLYIFSVPVFTEADVVCLPIDLSWNGRVKHFYYSKNNLENSWAHPFVYKIDFWCKASFITAQTGIDQPIKNRVMVSAALLETPTRIGFSV